MGKDVEVLGGCIDCNLNDEETFTPGIRPHDLLLSFSSASFYEREREKY